MRGRFQCAGVYVEDPYTTTDVNSGVPLTLPLTRDALETMIRRLVRESRPNVEFYAGSVTSLKASDEGRLVRGVEYRRPDGEVKEEDGDIYLGAGS